MLKQGIASRNRERNPVRLTSLEEVVFSTLEEPDMESCGEKLAAIILITEHGILVPI